MNSILPEYDIIVVGGGHAGCEAARAAAIMGSKTLLITLDMNNIAQMSCNPAVGGIAKGQLVREIDALGGAMGIITDKSTIQFRMLNRSKGPAMWGPRAQCDRMRFSLEWRKELDRIDGLDIWQDDATSLIIVNNEIKGIKTSIGTEFKAKKIILTNGTFFNGLIHIGDKNFNGGRISERASYGISEQLCQLGFETGRMKTGTPVRINSKSIDFEKLTIQNGDNDYHCFSYLNIEGSNNGLKKLPCFMAYTNLEVHNILREGFDDSPLFNGRIQSIGPRYCPSIETKLDTFSDKDSHHLFLEPEGEETNEYYLNGFSSSLPWDIQIRALKKVEGFENVRIYRPGYAIEYDFFPPTQLKHSLETKLIKGLYFAGQINGTTGYEEAGAQGLIAAINANLAINNKDSFILKRDEAYIGVLIDDLVTKGVDEPYRMFTSRAEFRILLRQDNADIRLTPKGYSIGLVNQNRMDILNKKINEINKFDNFINNNSVKPEEINDFLKNVKSAIIKNKTKIKDILSRPQVNIFDLIENYEPLKIFIKENNLRYEIIESSEISLKYSGYIERERLLAEKVSRLENIVIKDKFNYSEILNLSMEARQKLEKIKPSTLGQASRIIGVSPADINVLLVLLGR